MMMMLPKYINYLLYFKRKNNYYMKKCSYLNVNVKKLTVLCNIYIICMYNVCVLIYVVKEKSKEQNPNPRKKTHS